jgi:hypothetical protein
VEDEWTIAASWLSRLAQVRSQRRSAPSRSRDRIVSTLKAAGLTGTILALHEQAQAAHTLIEIAGYVALDDHRLAAFSAQVIPTLQRILLLGGYAVPFAEDDLKP